MNINNKTTHKIFYKDARKMDYIKSKSVDFVLTSPPYPMIKMWDDIFCKQNKVIKKYLKNGDGKMAFELMHKELDKVWKESYRVLKNGGIACINIGDATRTIDENFVLYPNCSRITDYCFSLGFDVLPSLIWRKQTNSPTKFMGSGMLPVGAYVTLEHEYILILRKNGKRRFIKDGEKSLRRESSFFWEERNKWFSDVWFDIKGKKQRLFDKKVRERSAAFPFELAYRLINMYSVKNDIVLDPFVGTGTTSAAAIVAERNSIGIEVDKFFRNTIEEYLKSLNSFSGKVIDKRIKEHNEFISKRKRQHKQIKYQNDNYCFPVVTKSEKKIKFRKLLNIKKINDIFCAEYDNQKLKVIFIPSFILNISTLSSEVSRVIEIIFLICGDAIENNFTIKV